ncbi:MAG: hypothetical protein R3B82_26770 [Sandaracinaceae bacterium]
MRTLVGVVPLLALLGVSCVEPAEPDAEPWDRQRGLGRGAGARTLGSRTLGSRTPVL